MSLVPSPLKSPASTGTEPAGCEPRSELPAHWPLEIFQRSMSFVVGLYHATSLVPSPLKSPVSAGVNPAGWAPRLVVPAHWPLEIFHRSTSWVVGLNQHIAGPVAVVVSEQNRLVVGGMRAH